LAGFAGAVGTIASVMDLEAVANALSFTGEEIACSYSSDGFSGLSVAHYHETRRFPRLIELRDICFLIDGEIIDIHTDHGQVSKPEQYPEEIELLFYKEGTSFARRLNGSFSIAVFDLRSGELHLIADRMGSRPFFYFKGDGYLAFSSRIEAFTQMGIRKADKINPRGLAEVLVFQRTLCENIWEGVHTVPSAQVITYKANCLSSERYWKMSFHYGSGSQSLNENANNLAQVFKSAVEKRISGWDRVGLLLSGGLDSRTVLACLPERTECYTMCDHNNLETRVATHITRAKNCNLVLLKRTPGHYLEIARTSSRICEGAYDYIHAHTEGLLGRIPDRTVMFTGFFIDMLMKGYNLPSRSTMIRGKNLGAPRYCMIEESELETEVLKKLSTVSGAGIRALEVLSKDLKAELRNHPLVAIRSFVERNLASGASTSDVLELISFEQSFRHLHFPFITAIRHRMVERCVCFDNDLLDIILGIPPEQRFNGMLFRNVIGVIDPQLSKIINANTLLPLTASGGLIKLVSVTRKNCREFSISLMKKTGLGGPAWVHTGGSWHDIGELWKGDMALQYLDDILHDDVAMRDDLIDIGSVKKMASLHKQGQGNYSRILTMLISFLEWRRQP